MATWHDEITPEQAELIGRAPLFLVAASRPQQLEAETEAQIRPP